MLKLKHMKYFKNKKARIVTIVAALFLSAVGVFYAVGGEIIFQFKVPAQTAAEMAVKYINENFNLGDNTASLVSVSEMKLAYKLSLKIGSNDFMSYVTKDGKMLYPDGYELGQQNPANNDQQPAEISKSDKPKVDLFVMSFCPFGNQAEDTMKPVYDLLKDKVDWNIHYIVDVNGNQVSSLHGQVEVDQNEREACVLRDAGLAKWWEFTAYVNEKCGNDGSCWTAAAQNAGLDKQTITSCVDQDGLALMEGEAAATAAAEASGSPTLFINGTQSTAVYQYGNPQAYLDEICSAFNAAPAECSQQLSTSTSASSGGSCN
jgi:glutaredoxin